MSKSTVTEGTKLKSKVKELSMLLNNDINKKKCALIVEGPDDKKFYSIFTNSTSVVVYPAGGCPYLLEILNIIDNNQELRTKVLAIKDADFDYLEERTYDYDNLFMTDEHDWETMTMTDDSEKKIAIEFLDKESNGLFVQVMSDLSNYSYIRYYNDCAVRERNENGILFEGLKIKSFYDGSCAVDLRKVLDILKSHGNNDKLDVFPNVSTIKAFKYKHQVSNLRQLSRGHDVVDALGYHINSLAGKKINVNRDIISKMLRAGFSNHDFVATKLYKDIYQWSESHGYRIWAI